MTTVFQMSFCPVWVNCYLSRQAELSVNMVSFLQLGFRKIADYHSGVDKFYAKFEIVFAILHQATYCAT